MAIKKEDIIKALEEMKLTDLNDLVKAIEEHFGVTASVPTATVAPTEVASEGPSEYNVVITGLGSEKLKTIKAISSFFTDPANKKSLMDINKMVATLPATLFEKVKPEEAEKIKKTLHDAGAVVELK